MVLLLSIMLFNVPTHPVHGQVMYGTDVFFDWMGYGSYALVDDNALFTSPLRIERGTVVSLIPGTYYWRVSGLGIINTFVVDSVLALAVDDAVTNIGTERVAVAVKEDGMLTGSFVLNVGEHQQINGQQQGTEIVGSLYDV